MCNQNMDVKWLAGIAICSNMAVICLFHTDLAIDWSFRTIYVSIWTAHDSDIVMIIVMRRSEQSCGIARNSINVDCR